MIAKGTIDSKKKPFTDFENYPYISGQKKAPELLDQSGNIENFIGYAQIPIGIAGPLKMNGQYAKGEFQIPLATTEGALVASYNRGAKVLSIVGGVKTFIIDEGVQRSPSFHFESTEELLRFKSWIDEQHSVFKFLTRQSSNYATLKKITCIIEANKLILLLEFYTGDAAGQNMVTFCTEEICKYILRNSNVRPQKWYIESNFCGDKKANHHAFQNVRGKKVVAEAVIPAQIVRDVLKTRVSDIEAYWKSSLLSQIQSGAIGAQGHVANGLTALFIACGQDVACVSEASVGIGRLEATASGDLYASLTLPNLIVGTVGGGTGLATQNECLKILDCNGAGNSQKFAEICAGLALAGELSIAAAIAAGHFASAHQKLGR